MKRCILLFWSLALLAPAFGQQKIPVRSTSPFILGVTDTLHSAVLGETRTLNIYLPDNYSPDSAATYPVIYLLDGSAHEDFVHITGIVQFLTMIGTMPPTIVVGIANVDRRRDFTFPTTIAQDKKDYPTTGGSAQFIMFLEKELEPFIQRNYKTNHYRTIIGQSLGGLLATEILLEKPGLFNQYIIVSPSLWWDNESLLARAPELLSRTADPKIKIYLSIGNEGQMEENDAKNLLKVLHDARKNWETYFMPLPEETHLTILHNSVYKAFQILYPQKDTTKK